MSSRVVTKERLREVFARALDLPAGTDCDGMEYQNEPRWDSVAHLNLIVELERVFDIVVSNDDVLKMTSFARILETLQRSETRE